MAASTAAQPDLGQLVRPLIVLLAVAGAAHGYPGMLIFVLVLSIALMALAANFVASLLERHRWLAYLGIVVVAYVALDMIWRGMGEVWSAAGGIG